MTGVPPSGSGHSPKGGAASSTASPAEPSVPNAGFTPGPWEAKHFHVLVEGKGTVASVPNPWNDEAERQANTNLIAAAPELYTVLSEIIADDEAQYDINVRDRAWAALRKARGEVRP